MAADRPPARRIHATFFSHDTWPAAVVLVLIAVLWWRTNGPDGMRFRLAYLAAFPALYLVLRLRNPRLVLHQHYMEVRGPVTMPGGNHDGSGAVVDELDTGALIRLRDLARAEVEGDRVRLVWWHRAKTRAFSLQGLRPRDRDRVLAYLREKVSTEPARPVVPAA